MKILFYRNFIDNLSSAKKISRIFNLSMFGTVANLEEITDE